MTASRLEKLQGPVEAPWKRSIPPIARHVSSFTTAVSSLELFLENPLVMLVSPEVTPLHTCCCAFVLWATHTGDSLHRAQLLSIYTRHDPDVFAELEAGCLDRHDSF